MSENDVEMDWEQLRWRTLTGACPPTEGILPFLDAADCLSLDGAGKPQDAPTLWSIIGSAVPGFKPWYTGAIDEDDNGMGSEMGDEERHQPERL